MSVMARMCRPHEKEKEDIFYVFTSLGKLFTCTENPNKNISIQY